jgi:D-sedoheptulose 7-phosphate isomerase
MQSSFNASSVFQRALEEHLEVIHLLLQQQGMLEQIARRIAESVVNGKKVLWCGNGGSAADSQHLAAELVGRFRRERRGIPSVALTTDTSILTAIGNDYGYDRIFARQVEALCCPGDVLVGISTSGNSANVCAAISEARNRGAYTIAFTGASGGAMAELAHTTLRIASNDTARIQEGHIVCGHMFCDWIELAVSEHSVVMPVQNE